MQMSSSSSSVYSVESLSWAEGFLWVGGSSSIKQFDTTGSTAVLTNDRSLSSAPYGLAWDGEYFWIGYYENTTINRIDIGEIGSPNSPPDVQLRYTPSNPTAGQSVSFDASSSTDPEGYITQYEWDFDGDGISDAQGENTSRVFEEPGQYHVNLRIHDNTGGINQTNRSITIDPPAITTVQEATTVKQRQRDDTLVTTVASSGSSVSPSEPPAQSANDRSQTSSQGNVGKEQTGTNDAAGKLSLLEIGASIATITVALAGGTRWVYRRIKK
ncbi:PKD domain-containing protein [Halococcus sp. IIIV-5B]|nr:PKD domain-containing protein [Halococcus sp. IIIV-5B]